MRTTLYSNSLTMPGTLVTAERTVNQIGNNSSPQGASIPVMTHITFLEIQLSSVQFSCSVVSDSLRPHESQHSRLPVHHQLLEFTHSGLKGGIRRFHCFDVCPFEYCMGQIFFFFLFRMLLIICITIQYNFKCIKYS